MTENVRIRMYRQGLGDCFLLTFPSSGSEAHVLIDCGVLLGEENAEEKMQRVAKDIARTTKGRLDVLAVTHEHWDHISGFVHAGEIFDNEIRIDQVWLAWTERPHGKDELADELRERMARVGRAVKKVAHRLAASEDPAAKRTAERLKDLQLFSAAVDDSDGLAAKKDQETTADAMNWVKARGENGANMRYFDPGDGPIDLPGGSGVKVYVLGPPRDRRLLGRNDPSSRHPETYELAAAAGADVGFLSAVESLDEGSDARQPFDEWFDFGDDEATQRIFAEHYYAKGDEWRQIEYAWMEAGSRLALSLDSDTNNTCLVLAFELPGGGILLFPGDAQVGNWLSWEGLEWDARVGEASKKVTSRDLLARTILYKVGHHGSHNATLREKGLELMASQDLAAMLSVSRKTAKNMRWRFPHRKLFRRLQEKTGGRVLDADRGTPAVNPGVLTKPEWESFVVRTDVQKDWIDYFVPL